MARARRREQGSGTSCAPCERMRSQAMTVLEARLASGARPTPRWCCGASPPRRACRRRCASPRSRRRRASRRVGGRTERGRRPSRGDPGDDVGQHGPCEHSTVDFAFSRRFCTTPLTLAAPRSWASWLMSGVLDTPTRVRSDSGSTVARHRAAVLLTIFFGPNAATGDATALAVCARPAAVGWRRGRSSPSRAPSWRAGARSGRRCGAPRRRRARRTGPGSRRRGRTSAGAGRRRAYPLDRCDLVVRPNFPARS